MAPASNTSSASWTSSQHQHHAEALGSASTHSHLAAAAATAAAPLPFIAATSTGSATLPTSGDGWSTLSRPTSRAGKTSSGCETPAAFKSSHELNQGDSSDEEGTAGGKQQAAPISATATTAASATTADSTSTALAPLTAPPTHQRSLCVRHQRMADEGTTARLQKSIESLPLADQTAVNTVWALFSSSPAPRRSLILQGLLTMCCFSQLSLLSQELALAIRIDPFTLLPREISLKVLSHLDAISLGRAAQVSRIWRTLADDDLLWRNMCMQHIERKCEKCGWGLPLLSERRRRAKPIAAAPAAPKAPTASSSSSASSSVDSALGTGNLKRSITASANAAAQERHAKAGNAQAASPPAAAASASPAPPQATATRPLPSDGDSASCEEQRSAKRQRTELCNDADAAADVAAAAADAAAQSLIAPPVAPAAPAATRPWKSVYCERLAIERNWRRGRFTTRVLQGHTDGVMCLQFSDSLAHPAFPLLITGSYDRTARVWNMETGAELRVLRGHTRGVRCLQFDAAKLITGSMDRTLKIWNWRTGTLMRTLEGHTEGIVCLHFDHDTLASGSADSNVKIWDFRSGECFTLRGHSDWVNAVLLWSGPNSNKAAKAQGTVTNWGSELRADGGAKADADAGSFLFSASDDGTIRLWDLARRDCVLLLDGHVAQVQTIKLVMVSDESLRKLAQGAPGGPGADDADQRRLAERRARRRADADDHEPLPPLPAAANNSAAVACGYNAPAVPGGRAANAGFAPAMPSHLYNAAAAASSSSASSSSAAARRPSIMAPEGASDTQVSRRALDPTLAYLQSRLFAAGLVPALPLDAEAADLEGPLAPSNPSETAEGAAAPCSSVLRPVLLSGSLDNTIKAWDVRTGTAFRTLFGHTEGVWALDARAPLRAISGAHDKTLKVWDLTSGTCQQTLVGHVAPVTCVQLADDMAISGSDDGDVRIWSFRDE